MGVGVWAFFFFGLLDTNEPGPILLAVVVGLFFHTLMYAPQSAFFSELFGTSVRYTGASVGYQLASIFAGALAPIIAVELLGSADEKNTTAVAIYVALASVITVIAVYFAKETRAARYGTTEWCAARTTDQPVVTGEPARRDRPSRRSRRCGLSASPAASP